MSYLNEDSVNLIADQIEYLRGLADGLHNTSPVACNGIREAVEMIDAALVNIVAEPSAETAEDTPEPLATALEDDTELREEPEPVVMTWGASNVERPTIDATDEVTEQQAIEAGEPEPSQEQIDAILNDDTPFDEAPKPDYFTDEYS